MALALRLVADGFVCLFADLHGAAPLTAILTAPYMLQ
jgi:hypothetical protein